MVMQLPAYNVQMGQLRELNVHKPAMPPSYLQPSGMRFECSSNVVPGSGTLVPGKCQCFSRRLRVHNVDPDAATALVDAVDMFGPATVDDVKTIKMTGTANVTFFDARDAERAHRGIPKIHNLTSVIVESVKTDEVAVLVPLDASHEMIPQETLYCTLAQYGSLDYFHFERLPNDKVQLLCAYHDVRGSWLVPSSLAVLYTKIYPRVVEVEHYRICNKSSTNTYASAAPRVKPKISSAPSKDHLSLSFTPFVPIYGPPLKSPTVGYPDLLSPLANEVASLDGGYSPPLPTPAHTTSNSGTPAVQGSSFFGLKASTSTTSFTSIYRRDQDRLWFNAPVGGSSQPASTSPVGSQVEATPPVGSPKMQTPPLLPVPSSTPQQGLWGPRSPRSEELAVEAVTDAMSQLDMGLAPVDQSASGVITSNVVAKENQVNLDHIDKGLERRTTVMLRNIPNKVDQRTLQEFLDVTNVNTYDFLYLRMDFNNHCNVGYAFISFIHPSHVGTFARARCGCKWNKHNSDKIIDVSFANVQGKDALVQKFRNSPVMEMDPAYRPKLFFTDGPMKGKEQAFPKRNLRPPKS